MAGISDDAVIWVAGEATGKDEHGVTATSPTTDSLVSAVKFASGAPTGAPAANFGPFYINSANQKLYAWNGTIWTQVSGWNS